MPQPNAYIPLEKGTVIIASNEDEVYRVYVEEVIDERQISIVDGTGTQSYQTPESLFDNYWCFNPTKIEFYTPENKEVQKAHELEQITPP